MEIYNESKHGVMFAAQKHLLKLDREPAKLTSRDMFIPTCATCHMSGLNGLKVTHDTTERLSYNLAAPPVLLVGLVLGQTFGLRVVWRDLGHLVGWVAVGIGLVGTVLHLDSRFFREHTLQKPGLRGTVRGAAGLHGAGTAADHELHVRFGDKGVVALGDPACAGRIRRQLRF
jgi:hypothetical protein